MSSSLLAPTTAILWKIIEAHGIDPHAQFASTGIHPAVLSNSGERVPHDKFMHLMKDVATASGDLSMWLTAEEFWHPSHLGALGYAWLASSSLRTALGRLQRYRRIVSDVLELDYHENNEVFDICFSYQDTTPALYGRDALAVTVFTAMCRANCGKDFHPVRVQLAQPEPDDSNPYSERFACPVEFGCQHTHVILQTADLDAQLTTSNPELANLNDQLMMRYLANLNKNDIVSKVQVLILEQLPSGGVTESSIANALHMDSRTLQRRLQQHETSFKRLLNTIRNDLASKYLQDHNLTLTEISFMLGFSETSSFSRAYKRWTGLSPSEKRSSANGQPLGG